MVEATAPSLLAAGAVGFSLAPPLVNAGILADFWDGHVYPVCWLPSPLLGLLSTSPTYKQLGGGLYSGRSHHSRIRKRN